MVKLEVVSSIAAAISTVVVIVGIVFTSRQLRLLDAGRHGEVARWLYEVWGTPDAREAHRLIRQINELSTKDAIDSYNHMNDRDRYLFTFVYQLIEIMGMLRHSGAIHDDEVFGYFGIVVEKWGGNLGKIVHARYANERPYPMGLIYADNLYREYLVWGEKAHIKLFRRLGGDPLLLQPAPSAPRAGNSGEPPQASQRPGGSVAPCSADPQPGDWCSTASPASPSSKVKSSGNALLWPRD